MLHPNSNHISVTYRNNLTSFPISSISFLLFPIHRLFFRKMLTHITFQCADSPLGRFDPAALTDQAAMELLVSGFSDSCQRQFQGPTGEFRDVSSWDIVMSHHEGKVLELEILGMAGDDEEALSGTFETKYLPRSMHTLVIAYCSFESSFSFAGLPPTSQSLNIIEVPFSGTLDWASLPEEIDRIALVNTGFSGSVDLTVLPDSLKELSLRSNRFEGEICLTSLPPRMFLLLIQDSNLTGSVDLSRLPETLVELDLSSNGLTGEVSLEALPVKMQCLNISDNAFTGELAIDTLPAAMCDLFVFANDFSGEIDLSVAHAGFRLDAHSEPQFAHRRGTKMRNAKLRVKKRNDA